MSTTTRTTAALFALTVVLAGCTARDRAGGQADEDVVTLTFAQPNHDVPEQLTAFAAQVDKATRGTLQLEFRNGWRAGEPQYEVGTIEDVRSGNVDMAWVGARAFDRTGVTAFQPLLAPLLIDSHDLQGEVFAEGIPDEMLIGLEELDLVGIGVLPGPMRKLLSKGAPITSPEAVHGLSVGIQSSDLAAQTFSTVGASTVDLPSGADISDVDAYEQQLSSIWGNHYEEKGGASVVGNLNLWPRPLVIFIGRDSYDSLTAEQRAVLRAAAESAVAPALEASRAEDDIAVESLCQAGLEIVSAGESELAGWERAVGPVRDEIAADEEGGAWLARIQDLKSEAGAPPDAASCADASSGGTTAEGLLPEGSYEKPVTAEEWAEVGVPLPAGIYTMVIEGNTITIVEPDGAVGFQAPYEMLRDRIHTAAGQDTIDAIVRVDGDRLQFTDIDTGDCSDCQPYHVVWGGSAWVKADSAGDPLTGTR